MLLYAESVFLEGAELRLEVHDDPRYVLRYGDLVHFENGRKRVRGRTSAYEFRSIEQLRYDFEKEMRQLG
ncbi:MAG TPA: hypothetical protein VFB08_19075 [Burkholderiales bacterium]|nr:hypothetical protein [Burkholderiales bacterium]